MNYEYISKSGKFTGMKSFKLCLALITTLLVNSTAFGDPTTDLLEASRSQDTTTQQVQTLIKQGANVNARATGGITPLMRASMAQNSRTKNFSVHVIEALINAGADVNAQDSSGETALMYAAFISPSYSSILTLVDAGANVNIQDSSGRTALIHALITRKPNLGVIMALIQSGANFYIRDKKGMTALDYAKDINDSKIREIFVNPSNAATNGLHGAVRRGNTTLSQILTLVQKNKADINAHNAFGNTALMLAARDNDNPAVIKALLALGADVNATNNNGDTALMFAVGKFNPNLNVVKILVNSGADIHAENKQGRSAFDMLSKTVKDFLDPSGSATEDLLSTSFYKTATLEQVRAKIQSGADLRAVDKSGHTALMTAAGLAEASTEVVQILIDSGADVNAHDRDGRTVLMHAAFWTRNPEIVRLLIKNGADVNAKSSSGYSVLTWAVNRNNAKLETIRILIEAGANPNSQDNKGRKAIYYARDNKIRAFLSRL